MNQTRKPQGAMPILILACAACLFALGAAPAHAGDYDISVVASGLVRPTGIAARDNNVVYFTQIPDPGVGGTSNTLDALFVRTGQIHNVSTGQPAPTNVAFDRWGNVFWTCMTAGVILKRTPSGEQTKFLTGLLQPSGITVNDEGDVLFTELPTPGIKGDDGGYNDVSVSDGTNTNSILIGNPAPTDIVIGHDGVAYWTCQTAGVILRRSQAGVITRLKTGLNKPTGIALDRDDDTLYYTEVPTPGVKGDDGGTNRVSKIDLRTGTTSVIHEGDPEPRDITVAPNGTVYWTCSSAGVIVQAKPRHHYPRWWFGSTWHGSGWDD